MMNTISEVWARLSAVQLLRFTSESHSATAWNGEGRGIVLVAEPYPDVLVFNESGRWQQMGGRELRFTNIFRWTRIAQRLQLEHLRFGAEKPVFLFAMVVNDKGIWHEETPHACREDSYGATLKLEADYICVNWLVKGPRRDERISYLYR